MATAAASNDKVVNGNHYEQLHKGRLNMYKSRVDVVLGAQWGDEGKGKVVDMLALDVDIVCRCQVSLSFFFLRASNHFRIDAGLEVKDICSSVKKSVTVYLVSQ